MPKNQGKDNQGISFEDLLGQYVKVRFMGIKAMSETKGVTKIVFDVEHKGEETSFGVIGDKVKESILAHGTKDDEDGKIYLMIPENILKMNEGKVQWLNTPLD